MPRREVPGRVEVSEPEAAWDLDPRILHLNHGSFGAVPRAVAAEQQHWRRMAESNPSAFFSRRLAGLVDGVRARAAGFVGADPGRFLFAPNVTGGIATVLASLRLGAGDEVLITDDTYPGVRAAVELMCGRVSARVVTAPLSPSDLGPGSLATAVLAAAGARTRVAIIDHITSSTAIRSDVASLTRALRAEGVIVVVDGAHAPGATALDVESVGADYYAGNFHKWCCAPRGSGFLAIAAERMGALSPGVAGALAGEGFPVGLEWWGTADYSAWLAIPAAFAFLEERGLDLVRQHNVGLADWGARAVADALGTPLVDSALPMRAVPLPDGTADTPLTARQLQAEIGEELGAEVAVTCARERGFLRLSAHLYNREDQYTTLAAALPAFLRARAG